jgi:hypothetical protein
MLRKPKNFVPPDFGMSTSSVQAKLSRAGASMTPSRAELTIAAVEARKFASLRGLILRVFGGEFFVFRRLKAFDKMPE